ncbi:hypothetical protein CUZ56_00246 [Saezia sanguinis]|uniref:DUF6900 domain-containing protein n=1 Tax=Saezia sanguinis TaxID=1965230 RepID=A0A433SG94_9BURK|nr:hypothetical protein [Saezia sanguinis]RUS67769.1 hypothetical protein CUZ56_00246 [Saezia sanguinis]
MSQSSKQSSVSADQDKTILQIAKKYFRVETLESRGLDGLDFYEVPVWSIQSALTDAYNAGQDSVRKKRQK